MMSLVQALSATSLQQASKVQRNPAVQSPHDSYCLSWTPPKTYLVEFTLRRKPPASSSSSGGISLHKLGRFLKVGAALRGHPSWSPRAHLVTLLNWNYNVWLIVKATLWVPAREWANRAWIRDMYNVQDTTGVASRSPIFSISARFAGWTRQSVRCFLEELSSGE